MHPADFAGLAGVRRTRVGRWVFRGRTYRSRALALRRVELEARGSGFVVGTADALRVVGQHGVVMIGGPCGLNVMAMRTVPRGQTYMVTRALPTVQFVAQAADLGFGVVRYWPATWISGW